MLLYQDLVNIWTLPIADNVWYISSLDKCNVILFDCSKFLKGKGWKAGCVYQNKILVLDSLKSDKDSFLNLGDQADFHRPRMFIRGYLITTLMERYGTIYFRKQWS